MNILYGVPGEGLGHTTRSKVVIGHLLAQGLTKEQAFLYGVAGFETALAGYRQQGNEVLFVRLGAELTLLSSNEKPTPRLAKAGGPVLPSFPMAH